MYKTDPHTHSLVSGHAYNTIKEMADAAAKKGIKTLGITEHGPDMVSLTTDEYFMNLTAIDRNAYGVLLLLGAEADIKDAEGSLDINENVLSALDIVITSFHKQCYTSGSMTENTRAAVKAMEKSFTAIMGHPDDGKFPLDYKELVYAARSCGVILEVNNASLTPDSYRLNGRENCMMMLDECAKQEAYVIVSSDAHTDTAIGDTGYAQDLLLEMDFPEKLILNDRPEMFFEHLRSKK